MLTASREISSRLHACCSTRAFVHGAFNSRPLQIPGVGPHLILFGKTAACGKKLFIIPSLVLRATNEI
jgi:hypothetical protein